MVHRYAMVLPLTSGPQVMPIPFIVDTQFVYLCSSAVQILKDIGVVKETTRPVYEYQLLGSVELRNPLANALLYFYERNEPRDI